jgi:chromosomal replication initiation ATPase DnaA
MTYRLFDEIEYLKGRYRFCETELRHLKGRIEIVEQSLFASLKEVDGLPVLVAHIIYQASIEYNVSIDRIRAGDQSRGADLAAARNLAIFRVRELGQFSWDKIAKWFNMTRARAETCAKAGKLIHLSKEVKT